jgi:hypothetical protein
MYSCSTCTQIMHCTRVVAMIRVALCCALRLLGVRLCYMYRAVYDWIRMTMTQRNLVVYFNRTETRTVSPGALLERYTAQQEAVMHGVYPGRQRLNRARYVRRDRLYTCTRKQVPSPASLPHSPTSHNNNSPVANQDLCHRNKRALQLADLTPSSTRRKEKFYRREHAERLGKSAAAAQPATAPHGSRRVLMMTTQVAFGRAITAADLQSTPEADLKFTFEKQQHGATPYHLQGNEDFYTTKNSRARRALEKNGWVELELERFWKARGKRPRAHADPAYGTAKETNCCLLAGEQETHKERKKESLLNQSSTSTAW